MSQLFLDPRCIPEEVGEFHPAEPLLEQIRNFGYVPDPSVLLPGDLILTAALDSDSKKPGAGWIRGAQGTRYGKEHARWHHAGVYLGIGFRVCDATPDRGVGEAHLLETLQESLIRVRRLPDLDMTQRWHIVVNTLTQMRQPYDRIRAIGLVTQAIVPFASAAPSIDEDSRICSELFTYAVSRATGTVLQNKETQEASPAFLSQCPELEDVPLRWSRIVPAISLQSGASL